LRTEIFYFSGTGNSLFIAKELAKRLDARITALASVAGRNDVAPEADAVGIVFPVYYGDLPAIVGRFAGKLTGLAGKYVFSVCCFGGAQGRSSRSLGRILAQRGGELCASYGVRMPQNAFHKPWEDHGKLFRICEKRLDLMAENTRSGVRGSFCASVAAELAAAPIYALAKPFLRRKYIELTGAPAHTETGRLIALAGKSFTVEGSCSGCGICAAVCPTGNIEIKDGLPVWKDGCENCLACYNWCPNKAVRCALTGNGYFYRHPRIALSDMIGSKKPGGYEPM